MSQMQAGSSLDDLLSSFLYVKKKNNNNNVKLVKTGHNGKYIVF